MEETISTDSNAVSTFTSAILSATETIDFKPTNTIYTSTSPASDELKTLMSSFEKTLTVYKTCLATEARNVQAVHHAIEKTDKKIKANIATTMQA